MKEDYNSERHWGRIIVLSIIAALLIGVGIFFYYSFFKQTKSELIEAIPTDAVFLYEVNDNTSFTEDMSPLLPYFNELTAMDALPAFETMHNALPAGKYDITISGHPQDNGTVLLFNMHTDKASFKHLLRALSIDPANCETFEQQKIYSYGTNYKNLYFVFFNHILSITTSKDLLKRSIIQHLHPKNLLSDGDFKRLYDLAEKNKKQNWLFLSATYLDGLGNYFNAKSANTIKSIKSLANWGAFQIRMSGNDIFLSGYTPANDKLLKRFSNLSAEKNIPEDLLPYHTVWYEYLELAQYDVCHFALPQDSISTYSYLLARYDTLSNSYSPFANTQHADDVRAAYPNGIFPVNDSILLPEGSTFDTNHYKAFIHKGNAYIFATSENAITAFMQDLATTGNLGENRFYKFAKGNIASSNLIEFTLYNTDKKTLAPLLNNQGMSSRFGQDLRIFSLTLSNITDDYAVVNIYLNFIK